MGGRHGSRDRLTKWLYERGGNQARSIEFLADRRSFGDILSDWQEAVSPGDVEGFIRNHLHLGHCLTREQFIELISDQKCPSPALGNYLSALVPATISTSHVLRNRARHTPDEHRGVISLSPAELASARLAALQQIANRADSDQSRLMMEAWRADLLERLSTAATMPLEPTATFVNLARYLGVPIGVLTGALPVPAERVSQIASQLSDVLETTPDELDTFKEATLAAFGCGDRRPKACGIFADTVRFLRHCAGMTQVELANRLGIDRNVAQLLEHGWNWDAQFTTRVGTTFDLPAPEKNLIAGIARDSTDCLAANPNLVEVVERFAGDGLTAEKYLSAAVKQPSLFYQSPATIEGNIRELVERFVGDGLTLEKYLSAAARHPQLFCQSPETIERNIRGIVERFASEGLMVKQYLAAAARQPQLFYQSPETIECNIRGLVKRFASEGLTVKQYLAAALRQPSLFYQSPETIAGHIRLVGDAYRNHSVKFGGTQGSNDTSLRPVLDFLCKRPLLLTLATKNVALRDYKAAWEDTPPSASSIYSRRSRSHVEREIAKHLGHEDLGMPVPPAEQLEDGGMTPAEAGRFVLRAMIHAGLIKSGSLGARGKS